MKHEHSTNLLIPLDIHCAPSQLLVLRSDCLRWWWNGGWNGGSGAAS
jgi:hypothetical protein